MRRRRFIGVCGAAAFGAVVSPSRVIAKQDLSSQQDGLGSLAKLGVLTPDFDPVPETEIVAMAPPGISIHSSRVRRQPGGARAFAEPPAVDNAVDALVELAPRAILFAYTSSSYAIGGQGEKVMRARLEARAPKSALLLTTGAAVDALRGLKVRRIALVHPPWFSEDVNTQGREYFSGQGFDVVRSTSVSPFRSFVEVPPAEVFEWTKANTPTDAEAVFIAGNGMRCVGVIHGLEQALRRPVLTANQVLLWQALRLVGVAAKVTEYGRIFSSVR